MATPAPDLASIVATARKIRAAEHAWWSAAYTEAKDRVPFADTLASLEGAPAKTLDKLISKLPPWHLALLARSAESTRRTTVTPGSQAQFIAGSLHVKGPLQLKGALVVSGDVTIEGPFIDMSEKWMLLVVGGNLTVHSIASSQSLLVCGDCTVRDLLWGHEMHCPLLVRGRLRAPLVVVTGYRPLKVGDIKGVKQQLVDPGADELASVLDPKLHADGEIKQRAMIKRLLDGASCAAPAKPSRREQVARRQP